MKKFCVLIIGFAFGFPAFASTVYQCDGPGEPRTILMMSLVPSHSFDYTPVDKSLPASRGIFVRNTVQGHLFELVDLASENPKKNIYLEFPKQYFTKDIFIALRTEVTPEARVKRSFFCYDISM